MIHIPDALQTLYTARVEQDGDSYTITVPASEIETGAIDVGETYRVALLRRTDDSTTKNGASTRSGGRRQRRRQDAGEGTPPVSEGETVRLSITEQGDQGDGIGYLDGYVVFVEGATPGDEVVVSIERAEPTFAIAEILKTTS